MKYHFSIILTFIFINNAFTQEQPKFILPVGNSKVVHSVFFSPDKKFISTCSGNAIQDGNSLIWQAKTGKLYKEYNSPFIKWDNTGFLALRLSKDGKNIVVFETESEKIVKNLLGHKSAISSIDWSPDGKRIVSIDSDNAILVWDVESGKSLKSFKGTQSFQEVSFSSDSKYIFITRRAGFDGGDIIVINNSSFTEVTRFKGRKIIYMPTEQKVAIYDKIEYLNYSLVVFDLNTGKQYAEYKELAAISANGFYALKKGEKKITLYDVLMKKIIVKLDANPIEMMKEAIISNDGKMLAVHYDFQRVKKGYCSYSNTQQIFRVFELQNGSRLCEFDQHMATICYFAWTNDSKNLVTCDHEFTTKVWDPKNASILYNLSGLTSGIVDIIKVSPDQKKVAVSYKGTNNFGDNVKIFDLSTGTLIHNLKTHCFWVNSIEWSSNSQELLTASIDQTAVVWDANSATKKLVINDLESPVNKAKWTPDGKKIVTVSGDFGSAYKGEIKLWEANTGKLLKDFIVKTEKVGDIAFSPAGDKIVAEAEKYSLKIWGLNSGTQIKVLTGHTDYINELYWTKDGKYIFSASFDNTVKQWDATTGKMIRSFETQIATFNVSIDEKYISVAGSVYDINTGESVNNSLFKEIPQLSSGIKLFGEELTLNFYNSTTNKSIVQVYTFDTTGYFIKTPDNFYSASRNTIHKMSFRIGSQLYSFEQFDLKYNRPDIVLERLGSVDKEAIKGYYNAYLKRLKKMNFTEDMLKEDFHLPEIKIKNFEYLPSIQETDELELDIDINDTKYKLDRINIFINDVPVYGSAGIDLRKENTQSLQKKISLQLCEGQNKIQVSVLNQAGAESYKETAYVTYKPKQSKKPDLYLVTIGDSKYADARFDLTYAAKDAEDIKKTFEGNSSYSNVFAYSYTNEKVTRENILKLKNELKKAKRDDVVIITVAGHGVLDKNLDYYLATYDMDFNNPSGKGIPYEELESLVDGIAPLKKVIFLDACHSGEVDKEEVEQLAVNTTSSGNVKFRAAGAGIQKKNLGLKTTSELMSELFTDLRKGTGATVISSAGGAEYAMESDQWKNGLFTYCLLHGLKDKAADANGDGQIMLSELQNYLRKEVTTLSNGAQQPTSRIENLTMDFRVW